MTRRLPDGGEDPGVEVPPPAVPEDRLTGGWERTDRRIETLFEVRGASVRGHTLVYEDRPLRAAVREATDGRLDQPFRFFFATRLTFRPPLPPGVGPAMVLPAVRSEAGDAFVADLRDRGFTAIERGRTERVRTERGERARLRKVTGEFALPAVERDLPVEGWIGVWNADGIHVAGGAYPAMSLATLFDAEGDAGDGLLARPPSTYRDDLLALIRGVG